MERIPVSQIENCCMAQEGDQCFDTSHQVARFRLRYPSVSMSEFDESFFRTLLDKASGVAEGERDANLVVGTASSSAGPGEHEKVAAAVQAVLDAEDKGVDYGERTSPYVCKCCKETCKRSEFLITATDANGNISPGYDWQGALDGLCFPCCTCSKDCCESWAREPMYADMSENAALRQFKRDADDLHTQRAIIKKKGWEALVRIEDVR